MHDPHNNITARDLTPLDELTNDELVAHERLYDTATILTEWDRVSGVIADNVMTGRDMSYFLNRDDILRALATNRGYTG